MHATVKPNTLELSQISKRFESLQALSRVSFKLRSGTVHTLFELAGLTGRAKPPNNLGKPIPIP
jgi:ABC-type sugar transport system ATPase subunit